MAMGRNPYPETSSHIEMFEIIRSKPSPSLSGVFGISPELIDFVEKW